MPHYLNHIITNFALALILLFFYQKNPFLTDTQLGLLLFGYFLGTVILTPDIDTRSEASRRCGVVCRPYRWFFTHRGISHHPVIGILSRIIYVLLITIFFIVIIYGIHTVISFIDVLIQYKLEMLSVIIGLFISNLFHILLDNI